MAIPSPPSVTTICTAALKQGGIPSPTTEQVSELAADGLQNVKTALWLANQTDHLLETRFYIALMAGKGYLSTPIDLDHEQYVDVYSGPEDYAGTAQAQVGTSITITLDAALTVEDTALMGLLIFLTGGTGVGQHRQLIGYDDSTKVATINTAWNTEPDATTTYLICTQMRRLIRDDEANASLSQLYPTIGYPTSYTKTAVVPLSGSSPAYRIFPAPDHDRYACVMTYTPNLTLLDETSTVFVKHLRERRALWLQGLKTEVMQRYDDDRYLPAFQIWQGLLKQYGTHNYNFGQVEGHR